MHTVIILSRHSSDLLKDFRFLFKPFMDDDTISFCDWNESGTDIDSAVPDLYKLIKGKSDWRAVIVDTEPAFGRKHGPVPDRKNPFDYPSERPDFEKPGVSSVPVIRLTHMLCGYPSSPVRNFENGYEYTDVLTGETQRVRASELSDDEFYRLSQTYRDALRPIYMQERIPDETLQAQEALEEKYSFMDVRPQEVYLVATRKHPDDDEHIYASWKSPFEIESSDFCRKNNYPGGCRFLCFDITNPENSRYMKELTEFWLAVLTVVINRIPASTLQAYKLYRLNVDISGEELSAMLNSHLNKMEAAYNFVQERLRMKPEYSFEEDEAIVEPQKIPVIFEGKTGSDLYIDTRHIGLSRDCPDDELVFWREAVSEKQGNIVGFLKAPRRAIDKACRYMKGRAAGFCGDEYELDRFQVADLEEEMDHLELEVLTSDTYSVIDEQRIRKELDKVDRQVRRDIAVRMPKMVVIASGAVVLFLYLVGYMPYIWNSMRLGSSRFFASLGLSFAAAALAAVGGVITLLILRRRMRASMERFNTLMRELVRNVNASAKKYEKYFSALCTFMKAQSIYNGISHKKDSVSQRMEKLLTHKRALAVSIDRDEQMAASFGIKRAADFERNVTRFFDEDKKPLDNPLYYYEADMNKSEIPLNTTGEMVRTPYKLVVGLMIDREEIYEEEKGGD